MKKVFSKNVIAIYPGGGLLQDEYFRNIRRRIFNEDPNEQKEEDGLTNKKNVGSPTGFGPNERAHNSGVGMSTGREDPQSQARGVGSWYNDGGQADDETGPGHSSTTADPYNNLFNEMFMRHDLQKTDRDRIVSNVNDINNMSPVKKHDRYTNNQKHNWYTEN